MTIAIGLALAGMAIILVGIIRIAQTTPDILMSRRMEPARWRQALTNLTILWIGMGVLDLASATHSGPATWYNLAFILSWVGLGILLGRQLWLAHRSDQPHQ